MPGWYSISMRKVLIVLAAITFAGCSKPAVVTQTPQPEPQALPVRNQSTGLVKGDKCELYDEKLTWVMAAQEPQYLSLALNAQNTGDQEGINTLKSEGKAGYLPNFTQVEIDELNTDGFIKVHGLKGKLIGKAFWVHARHVRKTIDK